MKFEEILDLEERSSFDFFWKEVSLSDRGYGLIRDNTKDRNVASIASVGFGLSALPAGTTGASGLQVSRDSKPWLITYALTSSSLV